MSVYLDIKSLYPHLKVNWNVLMCKICIARRLVVDIFPWCNANFVPFPIRTLVGRRIRNGSIASEKDDWTADMLVCVMMSHSVCKWDKYSHMASSLNVHGYSHHGFIVVVLVKVRMKWIILYYKYYKSLQHNTTVCGRGSGQPQTKIEHVLCTISNFQTLFFFFGKQYDYLEANFLKNSKMTLRF